MVATLNGIAFDELAGSPSFSGGRDGPKGQRRFKVAWTDADAFLAIFFPRAIRTGKGWVFPVSLAFPGKTWMAAQTFKLEPWDGETTTGYDSDGLRSYNHARITIDYESPEYDPSSNGTDPAKEGDQILADYSASFSAEMLKLGVSGWWWETRDSRNQYVPIKNEEASIVKVCPQIEHTLTWNYVPSPPFATIAQSVGCVNSDTKLFYAAAETLLFVGAEIKRSYHSQSGEEAWKATYKFLQRCINDGRTTVGWNHIWRNDTAAWDRPFSVSPDDATDPSKYKPIYQSVKFANLFKSDGSGDT